MSRLPRNPARVVVVAVGVNGSAADGAGVMGPGGTRVVVDDGSRARGPASRDLVAAHAAPSS